MPNPDDQKVAAAAYGMGARSVTTSSDGAVSVNYAAKNPFVQTSDSEAAKPFISTTRTSNGLNLVQEHYNNQVDSDILRALEGTPRKVRGARSKPSVMKYPEEIGSGEVPHVMQFKVFWRWENNDILLKMKMEAEKVKTGLESLRGMIRQENLTKENIEQSGLSSEQISALKELVNSSSVLKVVDPRYNDNLATLLSTNPNKAKELIEETIRAYDTRLQNIDTELQGETGKVGIDDQERLLILDRLQNTIQAGDINQAALSGSVVGLGVGAFIGFFLGGGIPGAIIGAEIGYLSGIGAGMLVEEGAKLYANQAVYDQMISIYLPYCTKINNEDAFQYEDSNQAVSKAVFDALGNTIATAKQGMEAAGIVSVDYVLGEGAANAARGVILNPRLEKLFKQKDFRNFAFSWEFYPKNKKEVEQIREIIEAFRYHSHPATENYAAGDGSTDELKQVQIILRVPAEFEIRFLSTNPNPQAAGFVENEYIPRIGRCALNSISVDYTPNSIYSSLADNSPSAVTITMNFSEMGILTREAVERGY